jgi:uncharacterized membrane protein
MKKASKSLVSIFVDGFMVLLPFLISYLLLGGLFDALMALTQPLIDLLPPGIFPDEWTHRAAAAIGLLMIFLLMGLAARTAVGMRFGTWIEDRILRKFAPYDILRSFSRRITGRDVPDELQPAFLESNPGVRELAFIVESPPEGDLTVFVPLAPTPGIGTLQLVDRSKVQPLDAPFMDAVGCLFNWGAGASALVEASKRNGEDRQAPDSPGV